MKMFDKFHVIVFSTWNEYFLNPNFDMKHTNLVNLI